MKKFVKIGLAVVGSMAVAGFSLAEVREYLQVAGNRVATSVRDSIPLSVEIDRMEVLLTKLDGQVSQQKYAVAKSKIALQDAEAEFSRAQAGCEGLLSDMQQLRNLTMVQTTSSCGTITVGYQKVSADDVRRALAYKLTSWKGSVEVCKAREQALVQQQNAYAALERQFTDWQSQRQLLAQRLETLKARHQTQQLASETDTTVFNSADLARATELADQIERELRIVEAQQALGNDPAISLLNNSVSETTSINVESEVDRILGNQVTEN